jgi:hypothetical protein
MTSTTSFRDLDVWQESMLLVEEIYAVSIVSPRVDRIGRMLNGLITSQQPAGPWQWCLMMVGLL